MPRLILLTENEQREFDYPPLLSTETKSICFSVDDQLYRRIKWLRTSTNQVGFLLQYAYFKACKRFFSVNKFTQQDVEYSSKVLGISMGKIDFDSYKGKTPIFHQSIILELLHYKPFDQTQKSWIAEEISHRIERVLEPKKLFFEVLELLHTNSIEIPSYHCLVDLITQHYVGYENELISTIREKLISEQEELLLRLLAVTKKRTAGTLNCYKMMNQSTQPKNINASVQLLEQIKALIKPLLPLIKSLSLTSQACQYYATWVKKAKLSQLRQFPDKYKMYLRLLAFLQHQYIVR